MVRRGGALLHAAMLCATLSASTPALRAGTLASRRTVCPNSFNGSEEVDVFRTFLPPDEFDYVDLAPPAFFIVGGIFRIATALSFRFPGRLGGGGWHRDSGARRDRRGRVARVGRLGDRNVRRDRPHLGRLVAHHGGARRTPARG